MNPVVDLFFEFVFIDEAVDLHGAEDMADAFADAALGNKRLAILNGQQNTGTPQVLTDGGGELCTLCCYNETDIDENMTALNGDQAR